MKKSVRILLPNSRHLFCFIILLQCITLTNSGVDAVSAGEKKSTLDLFAGPVQALTDTSHKLEPDRVILGERLFQDPRLAANNNMACISCHDLTSGGDDGLVTAIENDGQPGPLNTPTVFNASLNFRLNWVGNFSTLVGQTEANLLNPKHAATNWPELLPKLQADEVYRKAFAKSYDAINRETVLDALAEYMRSLITINSPFDRYLQGNKDAISEQAKLGYRLFRTYGCISCHQGSLLGGNMFARFGLFGDFFKDQDREMRSVDYGRYNITNDPMDRYVFRVPGLRNIDLTAPYFHDGSIPTLSEAVEIMAKYQLGTHLPETDRNAIVVFLQTLTGEYRNQQLRNKHPTN